jgi:hypothetical protein
VFPVKVRMLLLVLVLVLVLDYSGPPKFSVETG